MLVRCVSFGCSNIASSVDDYDLVPALHPRNLANLKCRTPPRTLNGMSPGVTVKEQSFQGAATVKVTVESNSEEEDSYEDEEVVVQAEQTLSSRHLQDRIAGRHFELLQMELKECRRRLAEERRARLKAESRLMEYELENARLHDANRSLSETLSGVGSRSAPPAFSALEDEAVLESIESSFTKFHAFLDLLKDAGLGQLASMAGINTSDFQPLGKPQLSSTVGPHPDGATSAIVGEVPNLPGGAVNTPTHRFPPPVREPLHKDRLLDTTFSHAGGDRQDPAVDDEAEPHQYLRPEIQQDSGSEHSFRSNKFLDNISFGKTFQTQPTSRRGETRSNSSHGNSFSNSHVTQSVRSHGSSPDSLSEIISDRAESAGSSGSRNYGMGRLVTVSQSGSKGSERKPCPGRAALKQVRPLGGQSDDES